MVFIWSFISKKFSTFLKKLTIKMPYLKKKNASALSSKTIFCP